MTKILPALSQPPIGYWKNFTQPSWRAMGMFADARVLEDGPLEQVLNTIFADAIARMERAFDSRVSQSLARMSGDLSMSIHLKNLAEAHRAHAAAIDHIRGETET